MRQLYFTFMLLILACVSFSAHADGMQSSLQDMFNNLGSVSNFTTPGHMSGPNGGVISGGSLFVRNHVMQPSLYSFTAPHINGGCGGIDMFGGSFSYINNQELEQYLKQIASNASTYAFTLGLKALCPACLDEMEKMQTWSQKMNSGMLNSCHVAQTMVNAGKDASFQELLSGFGLTQNGAASDNYSGTSQGPSKPSPAATIAGRDPVTAAQILQGNVVWRALNDGNVGGQFSFGDSTFLEEIMSLTGTVITCIPSGAPGTTNTAQTCPPGVGSGGDNRPGMPVQIPQPPSMSLRDLVYGSSDSGGIERLVCGDQGQCLSVTPTQDNSFTGLAQMIRDAFVGTNVDTVACDTGNGIIGRYLIGAESAPTNKDWAFINNTGNFGKEVLSLAKQDPAGACAFAWDWADLAATELAYSLANDALNATARAVATSNRDYSGSVEKLVASARTRLIDDHARIFREHTTTGSMDQTYMNMLQTLGPARTPNLAAPVVPQ